MADEWHTKWYSIQQMCEANVRSGCANAKTVQKKKFDASKLDTIACLPSQTLDATLSALHCSYPAINLVRHQAIGPSPLRSYDDRPESSRPGARAVLARASARSLHLDRHEVWSTKHQHRIV